MDHLFAAARRLPPDLRARTDHVTPAGRDRTAAHHSYRRRRLAAVKNICLSTCLQPP
jgi:hypothetical protein